MKYSLQPPSRTPNKLYFSGFATAAVYVSGSAHVTKLIKFDDEIYSEAVLKNILIIAGVEEAVHTCIQQLYNARFILETDDASGRTWTKKR